MTPVVMTPVVMTPVMETLKTLYRLPNLTRGSKAVLDRSPHERQEQFERQSAEIIAPVEMTPVVMTPVVMTPVTTGPEDPLPNLTRGSKSCIIGKPRRIGRNLPEIMTEAHGSTPSKVGQDYQQFSETASK
jgi:hypothetical protein